MSEEWQMPEYPYDQWKFAPEVGWYNPEDDPATATEEALLNEIQRLRAELDRIAPVLNHLLDGNS